MTTRVSMLLKSRTSTDMLPFSVCKSKNLVIRHIIEPSFQRHYQLPIFLSDINEHLIHVTIQYNNSQNLCLFKLTFRDNTNHGQLILF
jgi:hypothetical protein